MYIDLTHNFNNQMPVFPGDSAVELIKVADVAKDGVAAFEVKTGMHVGTHMDAPAHMLLGGKLLHEYPAQKFFGRGVIVDARGKSSAGEELLAGTDLQKGDIVLVCFDWESEFENEAYYQNYPEIGESLANRLCEAGVSIVGTDTPSPDRAPYKVHKTFFNNDVLIIENLAGLSQLIGKKNFEVIALPIKFEAEAALCRVVARV